MRFVRWFNFSTFLHVLLSLTIGITRFIDMRDDVGLLSMTTDSVLYVLTDKHEIMRKTFRFVDYIY